MSTESKLEQAFRDMEDYSAAGSWTDCMGAAALFGLLPNPKELEENDTDGSLTEACIATLGCKIEEDAPVMVAQMLGMFLQSQEKALRREAQMHETFGQCLRNISKGAPAPIAKLLNAQARTLDTLSANVDERADIIEKAGMALVEQDKSEHRRNMVAQAEKRDQIRELAARCAKDLAAQFDEEVGND